MRKFLSLILSAAFMTICFVGLDVLHESCEISKKSETNSAKPQKEIKLDIFENFIKVIIFDLIVKVKDITFRKLYRIF